MATRKATTPKAHGLPVVEPAPPADAGDTVTMVGRSGTKVTVPAHMAESMKRRGFK